MEEASIRDEIKDGSVKDRYTIQGLKKEVISEKVEENLKRLGEIVGASEDIIIRKFFVDGSPKRKAALIYIDGLIDNEMINEQVLSQLLFKSGIIAKAPYKIQEVFKDKLENLALPVGQIDIVNDLGSAIDKMLHGDTLLFLEGFIEVIVFDSKGWKSRGIKDSSTDPVIRGPKESFVETLRENTAMIRRKIQSPNLRIEHFTVGNETRTLYSLVYLHGIVDQDLLRELKKRLKNITIDAVLETGYLEEFIQDHPFSPFPQTKITDRPDKVAAAILEGRIAIIVDGSPIVITVPALFWEFFQTAEDYYDRFLIMSFLRQIRLLAFFITLILPSLYVAVTNYHIEMLPIQLALSISSGRQGVPFPAVVEATGMGIVFEILREAGLRLPKQIGQAVSIVGVLVVGDAAVNAGLVSSFMVIVTALTAIASFAIPTYNFATGVILYRLALVILSSILGLYGVMWGLMAILIYLAGMRSLNVPYLSPVAPLKRKEIKDIFIRAPWTQLLQRPSFISRDTKRQK